jgi:hypothetical protein
LAWFHGLWTCGVEVLEYWMIFSLTIKLSCNWNFQGDWNVPLLLLERSRWTGFNEIYLVKFGFRMWEILIFKWFLQLKIQINSKKTRFWKEKSAENVVTLESLPFKSSMISFHIGLFKKLIRTLQNNVHIFVFCNGFTLGPTAQATLVNIKLSFQRVCNWGGALDILWNNHFWYLNVAWTQGCVISQPFVSYQYLEE